MSLFIPLNFLTNFWLFYGLITCGNQFIAGSWLTSNNSFGPKHLEVRAGKPLVPSFKRQMTLVNSTTSSGIVESARKNVVSLSFFDYQSRKYYWTTLSLFKDHIPFLLLFHDQYIMNHVILLGFSTNYYSVVV